MHSVYDDGDAIAAGVRVGHHREIVGGLWDQMGEHQMAFLKARGLRPSDRLLDIGCGSLRLGHHAIAYLEPFGYFGTDINMSLIQAGHAAELDDALRAKAPLSQFAANGDFDFDHLIVPIDVAVAQSVFTHLPLNHLRRCLARLAPHMAPGGRLYATYFLCPDDRDLQAPLPQPGGGVVTHDYKDPYHYRLADLAFATDPACWAFEPIGDWGHPRGQQISAWRRLT